MADDLEKIRTVVDKDVFLHLSENLTQEWRNVGRYLKLSESDIDFLESDYKESQKEVNYQMLLKWKELNGENANYEILADALQKAKRKDLADFVNKEKDKCYLEQRKSAHDSPSRTITKKLKLTATSKSEEGVSTNIPDAEDVCTVRSLFSDVGTSSELPSRVTEMFHLLVQKLKQTYQRLTKNSRPVPYLNSCVNDVFVDTKLEELDNKTSSSGEDRWNPVTSYHNVVLDNDAQRLLLVGDPGFGKSTLSLQLAYEWCLANEESPLNQIDIFILIRHWEVRQVKSIFRVIQSFFLTEECTLKEEEIQEILEIPQLRMVFIFDGIDQLWKINEDLDVISIIKGTMFPDAKVVIMTPPDYPHSLLRPDMKRMRLTGFDDSMKHRYIRKAISQSASEQEKGDKLVKVFKENNLLADICHIPLFFTMYVHLLIWNPDLQMQQSITTYYNYLSVCFFSPMVDKKTMHPDRITSSREDRSLRLKLGEIAFDGLAQESQNQIWGKNTLAHKLGEYGYQKCKRVGLLVEEKHETEIRAKFFHKTMQEYYAACHLLHLCEDGDDEKVTKCLHKLNRTDSKYLFMFACGLDDKLAQIVINFLLCLGYSGRRPAIFAIMEINDVVKVKEYISRLCGGMITVAADNCSKPYQRAIFHLIQTASEYKIPIEFLEFNDLYGSVNIDTKHFEAANGLQLPNVSCLKSLGLRDNGREWTGEEFKHVLRYASRCNGLKYLTFSYCLVPLEVPDCSSLTNVIPKTLSVCWYSCGKYSARYHLYLDPFRWVCESSGYGKHILSQSNYEDMETWFRRSFSDSSWQKSHIFTPPEARNCVKDETLIKISHGITGDWRAIGARLQIDENALKEIARSRPTIDNTPQKKAYRMLLSWRQHNGEHVLKRALRNHFKDDVADELTNALFGSTYPLKATSTISRKGGKIQLNDTGVELHIPFDAIQDDQEEYEIQVTILPHHLYDEPATCFEDHSTVMVEIIPYNLSLQEPATLFLPHCLKLKSAQKADVQIFHSHKKTDEKLLWENVTKSVNFFLHESCCEIQLDRTCSIKYTVRGSQVEAKRLKWYALGGECKEDTEYVTVDVGYHPDLPGENKMYQEKLQDKFHGDSQSIVFFKDTQTDVNITLVETLPVWKLCPVPTIRMKIPSTLTQPSIEQSCSYTFQRPKPSITLPRCVLEISESPLRPKYRLTVNFRALQPPVDNKTVVTDGELFRLSHKLDDVWTNIGRRLHVKESDLHEISNQNYSHQLKTYLMLMKWKTRVGHTAFVEALQCEIKRELGHVPDTGDKKNPQITGKENLLLYTPDLSDKQSLVASSVISQKGGFVGIKDTEVELTIPPNAFQDPKEEHAVQLRILPHHLYDEPAQCFEDHSTVMVEILPNGLTLQHPASLFLPHCLKLKSIKDCEVRVFRSYHEEDQEPRWKDVTSSGAFSLTESDCEIEIDTFCWIKYTVRGSQVEAKRLISYALGENCSKDAEYVNVNVGYHLDIPGENKVTLSGKFLGDSQRFLFFKEPRDDLKIKLVEASNRWKLTPATENQRIIPFSQTEKQSSIEQSCSFEFQRLKRTSSLPQCVFEIFQDQHPMQPRLTITFTPRPLQSPMEEGAVSDNTDLIRQTLQTNLVEDRNVTAREMHPQSPQLDLGEDRVVKDSVLNPQTLQSHLGEDLVVKYTVLEDLASVILHDQWKPIGRKLGIPDSRLDDISGRFESLKEKVYQMFVAWRQREGRHAKIYTLEKTFRDCGRSDLADKLSTGDNEEIQ